MPYTKLFNSIITSTLWLEADHTRLVWITMLALADKNGEVQASIPGLAKLAGVPVAKCREALKCLSNPDPDSRTKVAEGRRIVEISGGWELINHAKYRRMASEEDARAANAKRQARHRERNAPVTPPNGPVTADDHKQRQKANPNSEGEEGLTEGTPSDEGAYPDWQEFSDFIEEERLDHIRDKRTSVFDDLDGNGWKDGNGEPVYDWRKYIRGLDDHIAKTTRREITTSIETF